MDTKQYQHATAALRCEKVYLLVVVEIKFLAIKRNFRGQIAEQMRNMEDISAEPSQV